MCAEIAYTNCPKGPVRLKMTRGNVYPDWMKVSLGANVLYGIQSKSAKPTWHAICATCETSHSVRFVKAAHPTAFHVEMAAKGGYLSECDARCLNGKRTCNCRCMGRCHGAGVCSCVKSDVSSA